MKKATSLFTLCFAFLFVLNFATVACERDDMPGNGGVVNYFGDSFVFNIVDDGDGVLPGTPEQYCQQLTPAEKKADCLNNSDTDEFGGALSWGDCGNNFVVDAPTCPMGKDAYLKCTVDSSICSACIYPAGAGHGPATEYCDDVDNDCDGQIDEDCPSECNLDADCDDGEGCTIDGCDKHLCEHSPIEGCQCDADTDCGDAEICDTNKCVPVPCEGTTGCRKAVATSHKCVIEDLPDGTDCGNATVCDGLETCKAGVCTLGTSLICDDANACTKDTCDPSKGCQFETLPECQCDADTDCGDAEICDTNKCVPVPCEGTTGCRKAVATSHKCVIEDLPDGTDCGNATVCDGLETCKAGVCTPGTALICADANACTTDTCNPITGCVNTATELCCRNDSECVASRPAGMPVYLLWGCTKVDGVTAGTCVGCEDDGDNICSNTEYLCSDGYDGDGDLLVDCYDSDCLDRSCDENHVCNAAHECVVIDCTPSCSGKTCGDDGCGGTCGDCGAGKICSATFACIDAPVVIPEVSTTCADGIDNDLDGKTDCADVGCANAEVCKNDPCVGITCGTGETCDAGVCVPTGMQIWCWDDTVSNQTQPSCYSHSTAQVTYWSPDRWKLAEHMVKAPPCVKTNPVATTYYPVAACCISTADQIAGGFCYQGLVFDPYLL